MNELSLFSGGGGGLLASHILGWRTIGYVEIDEYAQQVIAARIADGYLTKAPIFTDVYEFIQSGAANQYRGFTDVVTAGFPCQPFSVAGQGYAENDKRNLWPQTLAVIRAVRPYYIFLENVRNLINKEYFGQILEEISSSGYCVRYKVLSARESGAPHKRDRVWIVAHSDSAGCQE